jgi:two-component system KDP operon response regulator KdpE
VLVVEDDPPGRDVLLTVLRAHGWTARATASGREALDLCVAEEPDVVLLDLGLPDIDGIAVCRQLRRWTQVPILVLTADGTEERMVQALDEGADDYVVKPYSTPQLLARLRVALRRREQLAGVAATGVLHVGDLTIDLDAHAVVVGGAPVELPRREFGLLTALARNAGKVVTSKSLALQVWGVEPANRANSLRNLVNHVRRVLGTGPKRPRLVTELGVGYRLLRPDDAPAAPEVPNATTAPEAPEAPGPPEASDRRQT